MTEHTHSDTRQSRIPVLFDMDGVILTDRGTDPAVYAEAADITLQALNATPTPEQHEIFRDLRCDTEFDQACHALGIDPAEFWRNREHHASQLTHDRLRAGRRGLHDDVDIIRELPSTRSLALVSNNRHETVEFVTQHYDFESVFSIVRGRDPTIAGFNRRKPEPNYLRETLDTLAEDTGVYIGDREKDYIAASRAGMHFVHLNRPAHGDAPVSEAAAVIESLTELPAALETIDETH